MNNKLVKYIFSIPNILILLYFIPYIGVLLAIFRPLIYNDQKKLTTIFTLMAIAMILLLPKGLELVFSILNINTNSIMYLDDVLNSSIYLKVIDYAKFLISFNIILLIITVITGNLFSRGIDLIKSYISKVEKTEAEISEKNNLKIKEQQERAKNTRLVYCPHCGADNILTGKVGSCKFCRRKIK